MKQISLTQNKTTLVDDLDFEYLNQFKWHAIKYSKSNIWYAEANINSKKVRMHRVIMQAEKGQKIDHEDGDGLNNQRYNLRYATHAQNMRNSKLHIDNTSGYKGVRLFKQHFVKKPWEARITINKQLLHIGYYSTAVEAAIAYNQKAIELHGEFARLNIIEE